METDAPVNCIVGNNGVGKTTILDAIYYLSFCKSFFNPIDRQNIRYEQDFFVLQAEYLFKEEKQALYCGVKKGQKKKFKRNGKEYERLADHIGLFPAVMISPLDSELIVGGSDIRRKFLDGIIAQLDPLYLDHLMQYNKALQQRNALLKFFGKERIWQEENLLVWDEALSKHGTYVYEKRQSFFIDFLPIFQERYRFLGETSEKVSIGYKSQLHEGDFLDILQAYRDKDRMSSYSNVGIHKDDLEFMLNDHPVKRFGSQGQQKTFLISLKLSQFEFMHRMKGFFPILLLDDIFDKLDASRVSRLMELVSKDNFGQVFITDTDEVRVKNILEGHGVNYHLVEIKST